MSEPILAPGDRQSACWQKLRAHYEARLTALRRKNDTDLSAEQTRELRGRIREVKELLSLGTDQPILKSEDELFKD